MLGPKNIRWITNIKAPSGDSGGWAYMDVEQKNEFNLNFSSKAGASKLRIGEIVLLFQRVSGVTTLSHLVTPISMDLIDDIDINPKWRYARQVMVIARGRFPKPSTTLAQLSFTNAARGPVYDIEVINDGLTRQELQNLIWDVFAGDINDEHKLLFEEYTGERLIDEDEFSATEGALREEVRKHKFRERNRELVARKKKNAEASGKLFCECCDFNFQSYYGSIGQGFIECHHIEPIGQRAGSTETSLADLALVCSNCHRMLHRKNQYNEYYSISGLKAVISARK